VSANAEPKPCESIGVVYSADVFVTRADGSTEETVLFVVCSKEGYLTIVDTNGTSYPDRESFLEDNDLFTEDDTLILPRNFPSPDPGPLESVPGHAPEMGPGWWIAGGGVLAMALAGGGYLLWHRHLVRKLGEEDRERKTPLNLEGGGELFDTDLRTAPPVIDGTDDE
jgi:hypothetical protein